MAAKSQDGVKVGVFTKKIDWDATYQETCELFFDA
jgi:hypothetical protein